MTPTLPSGFNVLLPVDLQRRLMELIDTAQQLCWVAMAVLVVIGIQRLLKR
jgi:hypothetical protein